MKQFVYFLGALALAGALSACAISSTPAASRTSVPTNGTPPAQPTSPDASVPTMVMSNEHGCAFTVEVEIAATPEQLQTGLMNRTSLPENKGMLFDFTQYGEAVSIPFYMKNTLIPLSIAFIDKDGVIVDIQDMEPMTETLHYSAKPYRKALEVNKGWFEKTGIKVGDKAQLQ
ncbi:MAG: DUF192 domain-containing protein [Chloroflexi bacterium]|nr:DUF192 domain-containing protein [Chloroflexota bacterium]